MTLEQECRQTVNRLRGALIDLYDAVGADPMAPQDVARRFKLNKTLTWKFAKLIQNDDGLAAVPHVPGSTSIEKFLSATKLRGASERVIGNVRQAARDFERMIEVHVGDRTTLDLVIDGMAGTGDDGLESSRKKAFWGNSGIYGVQAKTRLTCCILVPNRENPDLLDMAMVRSYLGLRRLRPTIRIPVFRIRQWSLAGQSIGSAEWQPLDPASGDPFLRQFGKGELPKIRKVQSEHSVDYVLEPGPIGNAGAQDCWFADAMRGGASRFRTDRDITGEFGLVTTIPTERVVFDLIVHPDLRFVLDDTVLVHAHFFGGGTDDAELDDAALLPIRAEAKPLPGPPMTIATPHVRNYSTLMRYACERMEWDPDDLVGSRLELAYPPLGSTITRRFSLPER